MMILLVVLLCGVVLFCLQSWLKRCRIDDPPRRTVAVFAVGDLDLIYGELSAYFWIPLWVLEKLSLQNISIRLKMHPYWETQRHVLKRDHTRGK